MLAAMELRDLDATPADVPPTDAPDLACLTCGKGLVYGGRGRKPQYCEDHKPNRNNTAPKSRTGNSVNALIVRIEQFYATISFGMSWLPVEGISDDAKIIADNAHDLAESWRTLLETNPTVRKYWEKMFTVSSYGMLISTHVMVLGPIIMRRARPELATVYTMPTVAESEK